MGMGGVSLAGGLHCSVNGQGAVFLFGGHLQLSIAPTPSSYFIFPEKNSVPSPWLG